MALEIERKYLIRIKNEKGLIESSPDTAIKEIVQTYLKCYEAGREKRIRQVYNKKEDETTYYFTSKTSVNNRNIEKDPLVRVEEEDRIDLQQYRLLLKQKDPETDTIEKVRICIPYQGLLLEIDKYKWWNDSNIAMMEVELECEDTQVKFPEEYIEVIKEVTYDKRFKNNALAKNHNVI